MRRIWRKAARALHGHGMNRPAAGADGTSRHCRRLWHPSRMADAPSHAQAHAETIADLHHAADVRAGRQQQWIESVTRRLGRPATFYACVGLLLAWVAVNLAARRLGFRPPDPAPFLGLQAVVTVTGLLLTTLVLITQNRQMHLAERRAQLDLHVNLLAEQKIAKLVSLVEELRRDSPQVRDRHDPVAEEMSKATDARAVVQALEESLEDSGKK